MRNPNQVGRYRIVGELGRGAMGAVYRAHDPQLDRPVAIKMISVALTGGSLPVDESEARFLREARVAARLIHPHIVAVFDAGREGDDLYLVMELVEGESLAARLARGDYPSPSEALELAAQAAEALAVAHAAGVVHRDVKPANILLTQDGRVKVSDFGVAKAIGEATELTRTGTLVGSPAYMAPEQIKGQTLDGRADLFSLGVVLYELLLRRKPFPADTVTTLVYQILHEDPLADPAIATGLPPAYAEWLRTCLAKDVAARVADGRSFAARCRALAASAAVAAGPPAVEPKAASAPAAAPVSVSPSVSRDAPTRIVGGTPPPVAPTAPPAPPSPPPPPPRATAAPPTVAAPALPTSTATGTARAPGRGWVWLVGAAAIAVVIAASALFLRTPQQPPAPGPATPVATLPVTVDETPTPVGTPFGLAGLPSTPTPTPAVEPEPIPTFYPPRGTPTAAPAATPVSATEGSTMALPTAVPATPTPTPLPPIAAVFTCRGLAEFHIDPEDAHVVVDGRDIGVSDDWDDTGGGGQWKLGAPGRHLASFVLEGYQTAWVELVVDPGAEEEVCNVDLDLDEAKKKR